MAIPACDTLWAHILKLKRGPPTAQLIGHDSVSADRSYVHTSPDAMRTALNALPAL